MEIARAAEVGGVYQGKNQLLRGRNIWVKIAVLRNSRREAGCAQRNTRFRARNSFRPCMKRVQYRTVEACVHDGDQSEPARSRRREKNVETGRGLL